MEHLDLSEIKHVAMQCFFVHCNEQLQIGAGHIL